MNDTKEIEVDVLIVGLAISGLALAKEMSFGDIHKLTFLGIERHSRPSQAAKATGVHPWTLAAIRHWGLEETIQAQSTEILGKRIILGNEVTHEDKFYEGDISIPQFILEKTILESMPDQTNLRWSTNMIDWTTNEDGRFAVTCRDKNTESEFVVLCRYIFGCDGDNSPTRRHTGIKYEDRAAQKNRSMCFEVSFHDSLKALDCRYMHLVAKDHPNLRVAIVPLGRGGWKLSMGKVEPDQEADVIQLLTEVERRSGLKFTPEDICFLAFYNTGSGISETFHNSAGNIFLVGDSAHRFQPFGGHGLNEAIGDAVEFGKALKMIAMDHSPHLIKVAQSRRLAALNTFDLVEEDKTKYYPK